MIVMDDFLQLLLLNHTAVCWARFSWIYQHIPFDIIRMGKDGTKATNITNLSKSTTWIHHIYIYIYIYISISSHILIYIYVDNYIYTYIYPILDVHLYQSFTLYPPLESISPRPRLAPPGLLTHVTARAHHAEASASNTRNLGHVGRSWGHGWVCLFIAGWWCNFTILKNDGVRQWEGWHPIYEMESHRIPWFQTTNHIGLVWGKIYRNKIIFAGKKTWKMLLCCSCRFARVNQAIDQMVR